ncbi:MAG: hypothetical protein ACREJC_06680 [Tepidisphaeraceae bacterium]
MTSVLSQADLILRAAPRSPGAKWSVRGLAGLAAIVLLFGMSYGAVMGAFGSFSQGRALQIAYSAIKVPVLLLATFLISLPSFFVLNTLLGVRDDFNRATAALISTQAGLTIVLASLAPLTALWYASFTDYQTAVAFNGGVFAVASFGAQIILRRLYRPLIARNRRHRLLLRTWIVIYTFVAIQMAWVLRPFVGDPTEPTRFFRTEAWGNAWEVIARLIWHLVTRQS